MSSFLQDIRFALRIFARRPGFTLTALVCLSLGIGATTSVYSVVNAILLRPYPYEKPDRLFLVKVRGSAGWENLAHSLPDFLDLRAQNKSFKAMTSIANNTATLMGNGDAEQLRSLAASPDFLPLLGVRPMLGRSFRPDEEKKGKNLVVILSYDLWQRRFGGDRAIVGKAITLDTFQHMVIGVLPKDFYFPMKADLLLPQVIDSGWTHRGNNSFQILGRLKDGVTAEQGEADLLVVFKRFPKDYYLAGKEIGVDLLPLQGFITRNERNPLLTLFAAVILVLLIACINVANLLLVVGVERKREITMRLALGASGSRVIRQILTENLLLAFLASGIGLLIAFQGVDLLRMLLPKNDIGKAPPISIDKTVLMVTMCGAVLTGILFGMFPALQASRQDLRGALQEGGTRTTMGKHGRWVRDGLVMSEVALALLLLVTAGLMTRSFVNLVKTNPGFDVSRTATFDINLPFLRFSSEQTTQLYNNLLQRVRAIPGVESAGMASWIPMSSSYSSWMYKVEGQPEPPPPGHVAVAWIVSPGYISAMGIPVLKGRAFTERDSAKGVPVIVISQSLARKHWPTEEAIGKRIRVGGPKGTALEVIGIVGDVHEKGMVEKSGPAFYVPYQDHGWADMKLVVRAKGDPLALAGAVRREIRASDKDIPLNIVRTMDEMLSQSVSPQRTMALLSGVLAAIAFVLAAAGIYGVIAYSVTQRSHEFGIRMAVGAGQGEIMRLVVLRGFRLVSLGIGVGLIATFGATRLIASQLYGVSPSDPLTLGTVCALLTGVAMAACYVPARWATRVEPMAVLRQE